MCLNIKYKVLYIYCDFYYKSLKNVGRDLTARL